MHDQIINFILENNILTKNQSAFRKLHSTITSLIGTTDYWYENIDSKKLNLTIFLDLRKALTVDHEIMIKKVMEIRYERQYWELVQIVSRSEEAMLFWKWAEIHG